MEDPRDRGGDHSSCSLFLFQFLCFQPFSGDCLLDAPTSALPLPTGLPGRSALYELDQQCKQIFGPGFRHCPNTSAQDICSQLWCHTDGAEPLCHTKNGSLPWADGTSCGPGRLCWDGRCLPEEEVEWPKVSDSHGGRGGGSMARKETAAGKVVWVRAAAWAGLLANGLSMLISKARSPRRLYSEPVEGQVLGSPSLLRLTLTQGHCRLARGVTQPRGRQAFTK